MYIYNLYRGLGIGDGFQLGFPLRHALGVAAAHLEDTAIGVARIHTDVDFIVGVLGRRHEATSGYIELSFQGASGRVGVVQQGIGC